jgi:6-phosphogluconolactonase
MQTLSSPYGSIYIGNTDEVYDAGAARIREAAASARGACGIALSGGSTPAAFFEWMRARDALTREDMAEVLWTVSDERMVAPSDPDSNMGQADRLLLEPMGIAGAAKVPWPTSLEPREAAEVFERVWLERMPEGRLFDLCFVGMGGDGHFLSLFPESTLLTQPPVNPFAAAEVPGTGWRLTTTLAGLEGCARIVVMVCGASKAERLQAVLEGESAPLKQPIQNLRAHAGRTTWLLDREAAIKLSK